ncbi:uncharacterized protein LACBIDRAFT_326754 [Laccaria bicolor S238N-H82]|uniref:Predicted protein n=1 Tax=Laccaria bicolor (strain S238N-H82 / ATCC MYA-4686) TaxID=486041 RepID=B0D9K5_LACBS|nr:uncharacterized protein LACBIDRAFT_326754 [Laccaria bicolor S238N-H82]EDR08597.1 predicted protein [Laccaria bicolor S238N-H82]|eukprot:XP_001880822.1 predicted protein [Laccaria bicolor S238N-H82]
MRPDFQTLIHYHPSPFWVPSQQGRTWAAPVPTILDLPAHRGPTIIEHPFTKTGQPEQVAITTHQFPNLCILTCTHDRIPTLSHLSRFHSQPFAQVACHIALPALTIVSTKQYDIIHVSTSPLHPLPEATQAMQTQFWGTCTSSTKIFDFWWLCNLNTRHFIMLPKFSSEPSVQTELAEPNRQFGYSSSSGPGSSETLNKRCVGYTNSSLISLMYQSSFVRQCHLQWHQNLQLNTLAAVHKAHEPPHPPFSTPSQTHPTSFTSSYHSWTSLMLLRISESFISPTVLEKSAYVFAQMDEGAAVSLRVPEGAFEGEEGRGCFVLRLGLSSTNDIMAMFKAAKWGGKGAWVGYVVVGAVKVEH